MKRSLRLTAAALALVLPPVAAVGCGVEKRRTVKQEFSAAQDHLANSKAASFTLGFGDAQGNLAKVLGKDGTLPPVLAAALLKGSITYVVDPAGDATLRSMSSADPANASETLKKVNLALIVRDDKAELAELRLIAGTLYLHVGLPEIEALAKAGGTDDLDATLTRAAGSDPRLTQVLADVRAGKWLSLPIGQYLDQVTALAGKAAPGQPTSVPSYDFSDLGSKAIAAVKPFVTVTDANDSSSDRVLDVSVRVRPALTALLGLLKAQTHTPFASLLASVGPAEIDKNVMDGLAKGTITLHHSHLTQVAVDLDSIRLLSNDPGTDSFAGVQVVVGVDDAASPLTAPTNLSTVDLGALVGQLVQDVMGGARARASLSLRTAH